MSDGFMTGYNLRNWLEAAFEGRAEVVGAGVSCDGEADIDVELEGCRYNITIKPIPAPVIILAPQNSAERLPSGDTAVPAAGTLSNPKLRIVDCVSRVCELCGGAGYVTYRDGIAYKTHDVEKEEHLIEDCPECKQAGHD